MKADILPLETDTYYHIYNRGINGEDVFKEERNYFFFLRRYAKYIQPVASTYAYCLLKNHFHLLIRTHSENAIMEHFPAARFEIPGLVISRQFSHLFNSYAQAINKSAGRTGALFETPFRRKAILSNAYLDQVIYYIHSNPQKHGFTDDFRSYPHSSYRIYMCDRPTKLEREEGLKTVGGLDGFCELHATKNIHLKNLDDFMLE